MKDFVKKVVGGNGITPPDNCLDAFNQYFEGAINTDWFDRKTCFEVIFYKDSIEHIAIFDKTGRLLEYKLYLPVNFLPEALKTNLESRGEIMNAVLRNKQNCIEYEVIIRDKEMKRHLILLSDLGKTLDEKLL